MANQLGVSVDAGSRCPTRLLDDTAAEEDLFGGPHGRVAAALAEVIRPDEGGRVIGLEGKWGTGKSTVINLLRKAMPKDRTVLFSFDAWAHEGDPLRRTFLEALTSTLRSEGWLSGEQAQKWEKELDRLSRRLTETDTTTFTYPTGLAKWLAGAALLVPVGAVFLDYGLTQWAPIRVSNSLNWFFLVGIVLTPAPVWVVIKEGIKIWRRKHEGGKSDPADWAFTTGHDKEETKQTAIETPEATSLEFERAFGSVMDKVMVHDGVLRGDRDAIVIVLDNLDRIQVDHALRVWATLQAFMQHRNSSPWFKRLWVLVPYDKDGLSRMWTKEEDDGLATESFFEKSFQVRFEVPPLVLGDWRKHLQALVVEALPEHALEAEQVYRVYNAGREKDGTVPTPRELKIFVNQIGAIHRQRQDHSIPLSHIAYYVALRKQLSQQQLRAQLLPGGVVPAPAVERLLDPEPDLRQSLAGLAFNTQPAKGMQLLLAEPLLDALCASHSEELLEMEAKYGDGFWAVFEELSSSRLAELDRDHLVSAAKCLRDGNFAEAGKAHIGEWAAVKRALGYCGERISNWLGLDLFMEDGLGTVCRVVNNDSVVKNILKSLRNEISRPATVKGGITGNNVDEFAAQIIKLIENLENWKLLEGTPEPFRLAVDEMAWTRAAAAMSSRPKLFVPEFPADKIVTWLSELVSAGTPWSLDAIRVTQACKPPVSWDALVTSIQLKLQTLSTPDGSDSVTNLVKVLDILCEAEFQTKTAYPALSEFVTSGNAVRWLSRANQIGNLECQGWCIAWLVVFQPSLESTSSAVDVKQGQALLMEKLASEDLVLAQVINHAIRDWGLEKLLAVAPEHRFKPLFALCHRLSADKRPQRVFTSEILADHWEGLAACLNDPARPERFGELVQLLCDEQDLVAKTERGGFKLDRASLYRAIWRASRDSKFRNWCIAGLKALNSSQWAGEFLNLGAGVQLLLSLQPLAENELLGAAYQDGIREYASQVLVGTTNPQEEVFANSSNLFSALGEASRAGIASDLLALMRGATGPPTAEFFALFSRLITPDAVRKESDIVGKVFNPILRDRSAAGLEWVAEILSSDIDLLRGRLGAESDLFRERLIGLANDKEGPADINVTAAKIADLLGLEIETGEKETLSNVTDS